jgi:SecD/SecF fusion protein
MNEAPVDLAQAAEEQAIREQPAGPQRAVLTYEVDPASSPVGMSASDLDKLLKAIDRRLNSGVEKVARLRKLDDGRIEVALLRSSDADRQRVERLLARPGTLEFRILASNRQDKAVIEQARKDRSKAEVLDSSGKRLAWWVPVKAGEEKSFAGDADIARRAKKQGRRDITEILVVGDPCNVSGAYLAKAEASTDNSGHLLVNFTLNDAGGKLFAKLTGDHLPDKSTDFKYRLGIILDGELCSAPSIRSVIAKQGKITGSFSKEEVADLVDVLNGGILPAPLLLVRIDKAAAAAPPGAAGAEDWSATAIRRGLAFLAARQPYHPAIG